MSKNFSVKIPTTPVLRKFIQKRYLEIGADAIKINNKTVLGSFLIGVLNKQNFETRFILQKKLSAISSFKDEIICVAPWSLFNSYGNKITMDQAIQINRYFDNYFDETLYLYCQKYTAGNTNRRCGFDKAINSFCDFYNISIEEDIYFDTLKKREYRFRTNIYDKLSATLSPQFHTNYTTQQSLFIV